jgi:hypothetical protein
MGWSMCMSAMCAMSCSGNMPLSVRFATMERCPWLARLCLRGDKNNHREWAIRASEKPIGEERRFGHEAMTMTCVYEIRTLDQFSNGFGTVSKRTDLVATRPKIVT